MTPDDEVEVYETEDIKQETIGEERATEATEDKAPPEL